MPGSPLDLLNLDEWSVEFVTWYDRRPTGIRNIFDNGQISVQVIDFKFSASINLNGTKYGVMSDILSVGAVPYRVAVTFKNQRLSVIVNGRTEASTIIPQLKSQKKRKFDSSIRIGGTPSEGVLDFAIGRTHACASAESGNLLCWGSNGNGQLGDQRNWYYFMPIVVEGVKNVSSISVGDRSTCVVKDSKVLCWGFNEFFNLGVGMPSTIYTPVEVPNVSDATEVKSGLDHSCAVSSTGLVTCWGRNHKGQLGHGYFNEAAPPLRVDIQNVNKLSLGSDHSCALKTDGTVWCWGDNSRGQLGQDPSLIPNSHSPLEVPISDIKNLTAGFLHTCVTTESQQIFCWGANEFGQLGNNSTADSFIPVQVDLNFGLVFEISSGLGNHTCASSSGGSYFCWGQNDRGQLGSFDLGSFSSIPVQINNLASNISTGGKTTCFQRMNKSLYCFGSNTSGMLGNGSIYGSMTEAREVLVTRESHFPGFIDDIRISDIARVEVIPPSLTYSQPGPTTTEPQPIIYINSNSSLPLDGNTINVSLNGTPIGGLWLNGNMIEGQLTAPFVFGENILEVSVSDIQGTKAFLREKILYSPASNVQDPIQVHSKQNVSCYLTAGGEVFCWGSNQAGQLGTTTVMHSSSPVKNPFLKNILDLYVSGNSICAKNRESKILCWGNNQAGQLGTGEDSVSRSFPVEIEFTKPVQKVLAGTNSFCAIHSDGTVSCWGENRFNMFGSDDYRTPKEIFGFNDVIDGSVGYNHVCFLKSDSTVWCQGLNNQGQLGNGTYTTQTTPSQMLVEERVIKVSTGYSNTCVITESGITKCTGTNLYNEIGLGIGSFNADYNNPIDINVVSDVIDIQIGEKLSCALSSVGAITCWGQNTHGEMGSGTIDRSLFSYEIPNLTFALMTVAQNTVCGLTPDKKIYCWGLNSIGQAGNALGTYVLVPVEVVPHTGNLTVLDKLVAGQVNTCMKRDGELFCWGNNEQGQIGFDSGNFLEVYPVKVQSLENAVQTSIGYALICHTTSLGKVFCGGFNNFGQAGRYSWEGQMISPAKEVPGLSGMIQVEAGLDFSCALKNDGTVWCWGANFFGQTGSPSLTSNLAPAMIPNFNEVSKIAVAKRGYHACAIKTNGSLWCWGRGNSGQLGGTEEKNPIPVRIESLGVGIQDFSLGSFHTCALKTDGKIYCFGDSSHGQLGLGVFVNNVAFEATPLKSRVLKLEAGQDHTCVLDESNAVYCWGRNHEGQLGIGNKITTGFPSKVIGNVKEFSSGSEHACVITVKNKLACWGFGGNGQFGNGTTESSSTPVFSDVTKK